MEARPQPPVARQPRLRGIERRDRERGGDLVDHRVVRVLRAREHGEVRHGLCGRLVARVHPAAVGAVEHRHERHDEARRRRRRAPLVGGAVIAAAGQREDSDDRGDGKRGPGQGAAHGTAARQAREDDPARAAVGAEARGRDELLLEVADEVVAHGFSSSRVRMPASPRETRLRMTDSDVRAASAISP